MSPRGKVFDLRPGERRRTLLLALSILTIVASYMMVKAVRDAVFLAKFSTTELALVYILIALTAGVLSAVGTRLGHGLPSHRLILATNGVVAASLLALWLGFIAVQAGWGGSLAAIIGPGMLRFLSLGTCAWLVLGGMTVGGVGGFAAARTT